MPRTEVRLMRNGGMKRATLGLAFGFAIGSAGAIAGCSTLPTSYESRLANHLSETGAKMYGAYWCPHCATQKDYFGAAASELPYVECDPAGFEAQVELCDLAGVEAYPTWVIEGDRYPGAQPLAQLALFSGFEGSD